MTDTPEVTSLWRKLNAVSDSIWKFRSKYSSWKHETGQWEAVIDEATTLLQSTTSEAEAHFTTALRMDGYLPFVRAAAQCCTLHIQLMQRYVENERTFDEVDRQCNLLLELLKLCEAFGTLTYVLFTGFSYEHPLK